MAAPPPPGPILISGLGLMGSSLAAALSRQGCELRLHHRRPEVARQAEARGWGQAQESLDADPTVRLVVLGAPVGALPDLVRAATEALPMAVVTDMGSSKGLLAAQLDTLAAAGRWVGSHPMCGSHLQGLDNADPDMFAGAACVVTPHPDCPPIALATVETLWRALGCHIHRRSPADHDRAVATVSHLPHLLASVAARLPDATALPLAAGGFRDTTRVAACAPSLWRDILLDNRIQVVAGLQQARRELDALAEALSAGDGAAIEAWLERGRQGRLAFDQR